MTASATGSASMPLSTRLWNVARSISVTGDSSGGGAHCGRERSDSAMPVFTKPGHSTETPTPVAPNMRRSLASVSEMVTTACFDALYGPMSGAETNPASEAVFTTWPSPCSMKRGTKARMPFTTPKRLTPSTHFQSVSVTSHIGPPMPTPALLCTTCTAPKFDTVWAARASTAPGSDTSVGTPSTDVPPDASSSTATFSPGSSMSASTSRMPSAAARRATARPIPLAPPVTTATLSRSSCTTPAPLVSSWPSCAAARYRLRQPLDDHGHALTATHAHRLETEPLVLVLEGVQEGGHDARPGHAEGVAEGDGTALHVELVPRDTQLLGARD